MKSVKPWLVGLGINEDEYRIWEQQAPNNTSFTFWCLLTYKLNSVTYLEWARTYYELPSLKLDFFSQLPNQTFWKKIESVANWSAEMLPIDEWDGVVYIACVEPLIDLEWSFPVQYVLAGAKDLDQYWSNLNANQEQSFNSIPPTPDLQFENTDLKTDITNLELIDAPVGLVDFSSSKPSLSPLPNLTDTKTESTAISHATSPSDSASQWDPYLKKIKNEFLNAMILKVEGESVQVIAQDSLFTPQTDKAHSQWSLQSPSAFRIVYRTNLPYLGHVVETPINQEFFSAWGFTELPNHILIQPVTKNGKVAYLILAIADKEKKNHSLLAAGKQLAEEFPIAPKAA